MDTGHGRAAAAILLITLWNWPTSRTKFGGVAPRHHPGKGAGTGVPYCTDGMNFAAGTSCPSRLGGQGIAMNQSKAT